MGVYYACDENDSEYLEHFGILGMKWGVRRFQNPDGSLTAEGRERYYGSKETKKLADRLQKVDTYSRDSDIPGRKIYGYHGNDSNGLIQRTARFAQMKNIASQVRDDYKVFSKARATKNKIERSVVNEKTLDGLSVKAADASWKKNRKEAEKNGFTLENLQNIFRVEDAKSFFLRGNIDGTYAFQWWLENSNDPKAKAWKENNKVYLDSYHSYQKKCESLLNEFLGEWADTRVDTIYSKDVPLSDKGQAIIDDIMMRWDEYENTFKAGKPVPIGKIPKLFL